MRVSQSLLAFLCDSVLFLFLYISKTILKSEPFKHDEVHFVNIHYFIGTSGKSSLRLPLIMEYMRALIDHANMLTLPLLGSVLH